MRAAAVQLEARIADVDHNLAASERLADEAAAAGAELIVLPEFFTSGVAFLPAVADAALPPDGAATDLLRDLARRHGAMTAGSFLCRDRDGEVRNAFVAFDREGEPVGRHDKDLPTMWENCFYVGGEDDGVLEADGMRLGVAMCWELMRTQTVRRLRGRVDLVIGGSHWWSVPASWPMSARMEATNERTARMAAETFPRYVGAPIVHASHAGTLECPMPWSPLRYRGHTEGSACIVDGHGTVLARRDWREGEGVVIADVEPGAVAPSLDAPDRFWLHRRGPVPAFAWMQQRAHGRRWYARHVRGRPAAAAPGRTGASA